MFDKCLPLCGVLQIDFCQCSQYGGKVTLCEVAVKQTEEDTTFWLNLGKKRKCKQDIFRISNILIKALEG